MNGASSVATLVSVTDNARFALAIYDITFDASPLGAAPTRMMPAATSGSKPNANASPAPTNGMIVNWQPSPINTGFGDLTTPTKSLALIAVPMPNMMICSSGTIRVLSSNSPQLTSGAGQHIANVTAAKI